MSRDLTAAMETAIDAGVFYPVGFVELDLDSAPVRLWTGIGNKSWDGKTWTGTGTLGSIGSIAESVNTPSSGLQLSLSGIPSEFVSMALAENYQGRQCSVWFGALDNLDDQNIIADPTLLYRGRMDSQPLDDGAETAVITVVVENRMVDVRRPNEARQTNEDHQRIYPGDTGFRYVANVAETPVRWGIKMSIADRISSGAGGRYTVIGGGIRIRND